MQTVSVALLALAAPLGTSAESINPVNKAVSMISELEAQITKEGQVAQQQYEELVDTCEDRVRNLGFEIKTGTSEAEALKAAVAQEVATSSALTAKVEELAAALATNNADLTAATQIRSKEAADFSAEEAELVETVDVLRRATGILQREMNKGGVAMVQLRNAGNLAHSLDIMLHASMITTGDASKVTAFVQAREAEEDEAPGAPAGAVYGSQSGNIVDTLEDLTEKAEEQLSDVRKKEVSARHNYELLKQSLEDEIKFATADMEESKKGIAESAQKKATASGDLGATTQELQEDKKAKRQVELNCQTAAATHASETKSRDEELRALAEAKRVITEATALNQVSLLQFARSELLSSRDLHRYEAVRLVRDLARKQHSKSLAQLAAQMTSSMQSSGTFDKVKDLISNMIARLEEEAGADATKKAYCDKELAESNAKKSEKSDEITKISTRIDRAAATSAQLKQEVAALEGELSKLSKTQAEMDKLRREESATFADNKATLEKGITGIKLALKILNEYYSADGKAHEAADGAASGIIGLLETVEADFAKNLAQISADEDAAADAYDATTKENQIDRTTKEQSLKYKSKESKELDKYATELTSDRSGVQAELDAVNEYLSKMEEQCIAKAESYSVRQDRYAAEIAGLKEALQILEGETALVQKHSKRRTLRGRSTLAL